MTVVAREFVVASDGTALLVEMTDAMSEAMDIWHDHAGTLPPEDIIRLMHTAQEQGHDPRWFVRKLIRLAAATRGT